MAIDAQNLGFVGFLEFFGFPVFLGFAKIRGSFMVFRSKNTTLEYILEYEPNINLVLHNVLPLD